MTEKRFEVVMNEFDEVEYIMDKVMMEDRDFVEFIDFVEDICKDNKRLKQAYTQLKHRHSLLHDVCIDAECDRDSYRKDITSLEKENEQLKLLIKKVLETTPIEHSLALDLKNSIRELYK